MTAIRSEIEKAGGQAIHMVADITSFAEIEALRQQAEQQFGPIDILVANAGASLTKPGPIEQIPVEGWRAYVDANLTGTFLTIKCILPGMKECRACNIITILSAAGRRAHPMSPVPYAAAKAGIQLLTQDLAAQAGRYGIRANCIAPETILTERNIQQIPDAQKQALIDSHPIKRLSTPDDVAEAALYIASYDSAWITGIILDVAGGAVLV
jgi:3-oxoacyl-[acyl-carrier protein] reductase